MRGRKERPLGAYGMPIWPLGATIRAWRRQRQLSLTALAIKAGLGPTSRGYISKLEHGVIRDPGEVLLARIAEALGVSVSSLLLHRQPEDVEAAEPAAAGSPGPEGSAEPAWGGPGSERQFAQAIERLERKVDRLVGVFGELELDRLTRDYERALAERDAETASTHFRAAMTLLDALPDSPPNRARRFALLARHGQVANLLMQFPEYHELLIRFEPEARQFGRRELLAAFLANKAWSEWALGRFEQSIASAEEAAALGRAASNPGVTGQAYVAQLWSHLYRGELTRALELQRAVFRERAKQFDYLWHFFAAAGCAKAYAWLGRWEAALQEIERAQLVAEEFSDESMTAFADWIRCLIYTYRGDLERAIVSGEKAVQGAATPVDQLWARGHLACAQIRAGALDRGIPSLAEGLATLRAARFIGGEYWALFLAEGYRRVGDDARARQTLEEHLAIAERCGMRFCLGVAHRLLGELALDAGPNAAAFAEAEASFEQSISLLSEIDAQAELALACAGFGRLLERRGDPARAAEHLEQALAIFTRLGAPDEVASAERALAALRGG